MRFMRLGRVVLGSVGLLAMGLSGVAGAQGHLPAWQPSAGHVQVPIWPSIPPGIPPGIPPAVPRDAGKSGGAEYSELVADKKELVAGRSWVAAEQVSVPTMTVYSPQGVNTGAAVVVFPGGGYEILAMDLEGSEVCDWLVSKGITCVLLKYRVPDSGPAYHEDCQCHIHPKVPAALQDAQRTVGLVRARAAELHIDPTKIGVMGFSAGGHLVANISTHFEKRAYAAVDAADKVSCRPDFAVAVYPGHMTENTKTEFGLNPEIPVTARTPPTFLVQAEDDNVDGVQQSLVYYIGLKKAGVPVEMHLFAQGGHAFGLRTTKLPITGWPRLVEVWLGTIGVLDAGTRDEKRGTRD